MSNPPRTHTHTQRKKDRKKIKIKPLNLRVHGEHFGLAGVVRVIKSRMDVVQRYVAVLFIQWTRDVELLVDHLQRRRPRVYQGSTPCRGVSVFARTH